ncbi:MAG: hypothetical protein ACREC5_07215, partial [Thermoplasmata archaeon]
MAFLWPTDWTPIAGSERLAGYRVARSGGIEVAISLSGEIAGARESTEPIRMKGVSYGPPTNSRALVPTLPEPEMSHATRRRLLLMGRSAGLGFFPPLAEVPKESEFVRPPATGPKPEPRPDFGVILVPSAAVAAYREYLSLIPMDKRTQRNFVWGAAWAIFTARIEAPTFGAVVRAVAGRGYDFQPGIIEQESYRPGTIPEDVVLGTPGQV